MRTSRGPAGVSFPSMTVRAASFFQASDVVHSPGITGSISRDDGLTMFRQTESQHRRHIGVQYAKTPNEVVICQIPKLAEMDIKMSKLYFGYRPLISGPARQIEND